ncbi:MAG: DUF3592 domain-containing protein [Candidatus Omnitrophica bacterium]|nr:DUF3592 domain-containing protein [Candidatus Omnitrophota bacterium]
MIKKIIYFVILVAGITILLWCFSIFKHSLDALHWPKTTGKIISSSLTINHLPKYLDSRENPLRWYGTEVRYEYFVDYVKYESTRLSFQNGDTRNPQNALMLINQYRDHPSVTVYYDPLDPSEAVLEPGNIGPIYMPFIFGGLLVFWSLFFFYQQSLEYARGAHSYIHKGQTYQGQGKVEEAFFEYNNALRVNPYYAYGYRSRGNLHYQERNWDQAIADFNRAIENGHKDATVYFSLANAYFIKEQYDKAWTYIQKAQEKNLNIEPEVLENIKKRLG